MFNERSALLDSWKHAADIDDANKFVDEFGPLPPRIRTISSSVADQGQFGTCFIHTIARVVVRYYYHQIKEDEEEEENAFCNEVINKIQRNTFIDKRCDDVNRE